MDERTITILDQAPPRRGESICPYCGVGCRVAVEADGNRVTRVRGAPDAAANAGRLCPKGGHLPRVLPTEDRLTFPQMRTGRGEPLQRVSWETAITTAADALGDIIKRHGPDAVAFYGSGQLDTEAWYLAGKLFKGALGTNNTDSNSRLCMASAVAGYRTSLGSDGPPACYDDIDHADLILLAGSNAADTHPVLFERIRAAKRTNPNLRLVVIDPRRTKTAAAADFHLAIAPGTDIALFNGVARLLLDHGRVDDAFVSASTEGFAEFEAFLRGLDLAEQAAICGLTREELEQFAGLAGTARAWLSMYCMGLNQSTVGMWKNNALINLHLLLGQIGRPGAGPLSLTGQPNAMGGREAGALAHMLPGYRLIEDAGHRAEVEQFWALPPGRIRPQTGLTAVEMFRELEPA